MSALDLIIKWAINDLPAWQSDAVRRILTQDKLTESDEEEILGMLKKVCGLDDPNNPAPEPKPLKRGDVSGDYVDPVKITLKAIKDLSGVNAIRNGSGLNFGHQGLTVIYGENGAGKSGYARVLKRACNARDTKEKIWPNVFDSGTAGPAKAKFKISINDGPDKEVSWEDGQDYPDDNPNILANISVFDSKCARVIVDENNEVTYLPYGAHVFESLVILLKNIKNKLETERPKPRKLEYADISPTTSIGQFISKLDHQTPIENVDKLSTWSEADEIELLKLSKRVAEAEVNDPEKQARKIRNLKERVSWLLDNVKNIENTLSPSKEDKIVKYIDKANVAEKALLIASQESLSNEPLSGAGENEWQILYNAAREYSIKLAYPGKEFPNIEDGSLCVLCMQPLSEDAKIRMKRFRDFMEDTTKKEAEEANKLLQAELMEIKELKVPNVETIKDILDEIRDRNAELAKELETYFHIMESRVKDLIKAIEEKEVRSISAYKTGPKEGIQIIIDNLENEAKEIEKTANSDVLVKIKGQKAELEARKLFTQRKQEIINYINELKLARKYEVCISKTDTRTITQKGKAIVSDALTPLLQDALKDELKALGAFHIPLNLKPSGASGETRHKLELNGCQHRKVTLSEILSEGEQRVVAIAGFMAELKIGGNRCPIVFDDPVSSLDHRYREKIAERIVQEALYRQVIVFTHDIAFLLTLRSKAGEVGVEFYPQTVRKTIEAGDCNDGLPWHAMNVKDRIADLSQKLKDIQPLYASNTDEYNRKAGYLYGLLRETWEAAIEEVLFNETIKRHSGEIHTKRLNSVDITTEDYKTIHMGMSKCSTWMFGHDKSKALDANRPSPDEIYMDITMLQDFVKDVHDRQRKLCKERKSALEPKTPEVG